MHGLREFWNTIMLIMYTLNTFPVINSRPFRLSLRLKGQFSRLEFQQSVYAHPQTNVLKSLVFTLPTGARDPYYRDEVGNVSTSNFRTNARKSTLELRPRYPLFGGWNYTWYHGYNVPLQNFLKTKGEKYILNVPFLETIKNATVDKAIVKVVLPEGAM